MNKPIVVYPGQKVPVSGQYRRPGGTEVTLVQGKTVPPTARPNQPTVLVDRTKHK